MAPNDSREQIAFDLLDAMRFVVVQHLLPTIDGKRQAVREYVLFDDDWRHRLGLEHYSRWPDMINATLREKQSRIADQAWTMFVEGRIDSRVAERVIGWREFTDKQRRH
ncbi:hypothetical protein D3C72_2138470 [compost metagenome]